LTWSRGAGLGEEEGEVTLLVGDGARRGEDGSEEVERGDGGRLQCGSVARLSWWHGTARRRRRYGLVVGAAWRKGSSDGWSGSHGWLGSEEEEEGSRGARRQLQGDKKREVAAAVGNRGRE
jgi:hypothetical protein